MLLYEFFDHPREGMGFLGEKDVEQDSKINIPTHDGITMQDIRLMAGDGPLTNKTILQAISVIRKQRRPQSIAKDKRSAK